MLEKTQEALELIAQDEFFAKHDVRFVGGTALSYIIEHRLSEDLDFAMLELPKDEIVKMMLKYGAVKKEHSNYIKDGASNDGFDIDDSHVMFELNGVKVDFFEPPFNILEKDVWNNIPYLHYRDTNVKLAAFDTIMYMKTMAFWNRKKYRDVFDVYRVLANEIQDYTPQKFIKMHQRYNITHTTEYLVSKVRSKEMFHERKGDEGINTLVEKPQAYEWYRNKLEKMLDEVYMNELYKD
ncbi:nucleotidyl transferase AbiEii/AbiGii toxin family protein [bacterium]|nr:nucleotidyl transferase AbiEii/AbiGii toxin family protein [bacterium]MBU1990717.1 nucleotidyl transferase AbiEii/AbiGii toxin family protein [bacterium]